MKAHSPLTLLNNVRRESQIANSLKRVKRPSTKEMIDRGNSISKFSDGNKSNSCQFSTAYPSHTPIKVASQRYRI